MNSNEQKQAQLRQQEAPVQVLPKGWKREELVRRNGLASGKIDVVYVSTDGKRFKSKYEMQKFLGDKFDLSLLDWKSGKPSKNALRKQKRLKNPAYLSKGVKYDTYLNLPIRQTASIFKQPVTVITNHQNEPSKVDAQTNLKYADKLKPTQLFWELRFDGLRAIENESSDGDDETIDEEIDQQLEIKAIQSYTENVVRSVAASLYLNPNKIISGQEKEFVKNARVHINREQPLIQNCSINEDEIKKQEAKVKELRASLAKAMEEYK